MTATRDITKRKRPAQTGQPILVRLQPDQLALLDSWIARQAAAPSRPEAVRQLMVVGLSASGD